MNSPRPKSTSEFAMAAELEKPFLRASYPEIHQIINQVEFVRPLLAISWLRQNYNKRLYSLVFPYDAPGYYEHGYQELLFGDDEALAEQSIQNFEKEIQEFSYLLCLMVISLFLYLLYVQSQLGNAKEAIGIVTSLFAAFSAVGINKFFQGRLRSPSLPVVSNLPISQNIKLFEEYLKFYLQISEDLHRLKLTEAKRQPLIHKLEISQKNILEIIEDIRESIVLQYQDTPVPEYDEIKNFLEKYNQK